MPGRIVGNGRIGTGVPRVGGRPGERVDLGCEHDNYHGLYRHVEIDDGDLDLYLMAGTTPGEVIAQFVRLIGGTALPPRWTLGYAQTAMGLADAPDAQARLHAFIDEIAQHRMPVSAFHYGSGYSMRGPRRYVYTWNRDKFPEPQALNARFHEAGLHVVANIKPCLLDDHPAFETLARLRSVTLAGEELSVTPSAVSHRIRQLESQLGIKLFARSDFQLSSDGAAYLGRVREALAVLQQVPGRGSAIFLHVWRGPRHPTAGCIALTNGEMREVWAVTPIGTKVEILP